MTAPDSGPEGPRRMEIELDIPGMEPEVNAAMRVRIADGLRRQEKNHGWIEKFVDKAVNRPPDTQTKNQHYISQFWLRLFAEGERREAKVAVLDIDGDPDADGFGPVMSVKDAAARRCLFTLKGEGGSAHEALMSFLETKAAPVFKKMAAGGLPPDDRDRFAVSAYLAFVLLHAPATMRFSDEKAEASIAETAREIKAEHGLDIGDHYDLDALKQRYTFSALFGRNTLISKAVLCFFSRSWHLVETPPEWPMALPMFPVVNWGQALLAARDLSVVLAPNRVLIMSWPTLPDTAVLDDKTCIAICESLLRHAEATDGRIIVHPDHIEHWGRGIKGHQAMKRTRD